ncbi:DUF4124 domain-containing protein [Variovorax sp. RHLX14]|uniref:DUF4124 domain-containing protein n=1 Tax=Variovorax sp. RHLX14 TaxID=1259731 RepID=UPI003F48EA32
MKTSHPLVMALVASFLALPMAASAQWQWIDKQGKKVFSDQAPPPDVPEKNILRRAGAPLSRPGIDSSSSTQSTPSTQDSAAASPRGAASSPPKPSGVDKELEEKTRKAEAEEKARQAAEAEKVAKAKADNCSRARQGKATFDSGIRVARLNAQGEREIMDDKARASENQRLQTVIDSDCK